MINIDSIILGDNQFFGVNHLSTEKGKITEERFKDISEIKKVIYYAVDNGVKGILFSTHPSIYQITDMIRQDPELKKLSIYVNVPFISKYVRMLSEKGMIKTIESVLMGKKGINKLLFLIESGLSVISSNYLEMANRLIDIEMGPFYDLNVKAIFLHDALTGLAIGYNMQSVIKNFYSYVSKKYKVIPAFDTLNFPATCEILSKAGIEEALIMSSFNKKGYFMNPSREACEIALQKHNHTLLAMSTLAAGSLHPEEAYEYLFSFKKIRNVVVGLSSREHADETFRILHKYIT